MTDAAGSQLTNFSQFKTTTPNSPISQPALLQKPVLAEMLFKLSSPLQSIVLERIRNGATEMFVFSPPFLPPLPLKELIRKQQSFQTPRKKSKPFVVKDQS